MPTRNLSLYNSYFFLNEEETKEFSVKVSNFTCESHSENPSEIPGIALFPYFEQQINTVPVRELS